MVQVGGAQVPGSEQLSWDMDAALESMFAKLQTLPPPMEVELSTGKFMGVYVMFVCLESGEGDDYIGGSGFYRGIIS